MSALLQGGPRRLGAGAIPGVAYNDGAIPPTRFHNGIPYSVSGSIAVDLGGTIDHYHQGLPFTAVGRLVVDTTGVVGHYGSGAAPFSALAPGRLLIGIVPGGGVSSGVAYTLTGQILGTEGPPD
jgi:hypothetical protein